MKRVISFMLAVVMVLSLVACGNKNTNSNALYKAGKYTKTAVGYNKDNPVEVEVVLSDQKIDSVNVLKHKETEGIGTVAVQKLPEAIVKAQSAKVDVIASATLTSNAILKAVGEILAENTIGKPDTSKQTNAKKEEAKTVDTDVLVIGAGGAGLSAAIEANNAGKNALIVEKAQLTGGNTTRATGGMNATHTKYQDKNEFSEAEVKAIKGRIEKARKDFPDLKELADTVEKQLKDYQASPKGYFDTKELFMLDTLVGGKDLNNKDLVKTLVDKSAETIDWLNTLGMELTSVGSFGGASVKRIHRPTKDGKTLAVGSYLIPKMTKIVEDKKIEIVFGKEVKELLVKDGKVVGAKADGLTVNAKSVVLATGGFAGNLKKVAEIKPELKGFVTTNAPQITGDGIWMAEKIGAKVVDLDQIQIHPTVEQETSSLITEGVRGDGAILVNQEGKRFVNETETRDKVSAEEIAQTGGYAYLIVDQNMLDKSAPLQGYKSKGFTKEGATIEDLAKEIKVDPNTLKETLEKWNKSVETKSDAEFNRTAFTQALNKGPFYAIKVSPGVHHTMGGLAINTNAEVLNKDGKVIPNLYAAGEVTGGIHGGNRLGGNAVSDILIFGRIAGQYAAKNAK